MKMYTQDAEGKIVLKPVSEVKDAEIILTQPAEPAPQQDRHPPLPFSGTNGIFCRYLDSKLILDGKGDVVPDKDILPTFEQSVHEFLKHAQPSQLRSGFYNWGQGGKEQLFISLGCGAILYEGLPANDGEIWLDYYGDQLGLRMLVVTPHHIKAEILQDLNEAFKMILKYQAEKK